MAVINVIPQIRRRRLLAHPPAWFYYICNASRFANIKRLSGIIKGSILISRASDDSIFFFRNGKKFSPGIVKRGRLKPSDPHWAQ